MYEDCCECIEANSLRDLLKNSIYHVFFKEFCSRLFSRSSPDTTPLLDIAKPLLDTTDALIASDGVASYFIPLFVPVLKAVAFSADCASLFQSVMRVLRAFSEVQDDFKMEANRCCRYDVLEVLLELLRVAPHLDPSPESVMMTFCDDAPALQTNEVLLLLGDRGMLSASEDVRLNALINLGSLTNDKPNVLYLVEVCVTRYA